MPHHTTRTLAIAAALLATPALAHAGDLEPPAGSVAPTMKTIQQAEPRTPLTQDNTPGDASNVFIIDKPGSYYLTADLNAGDSQTGIRVLASNVSIDLRGFTITGTLDSRDGIRLGEANIPVSSVEVRNGRIADMGWSGISGSDCTRARIIDLQLVDNDLSGMFVGDFAFVSSTIAASNGQGGIDVGQASHVDNAQAIGNGSTVTAGIDVGIGSTVLDCLSAQNADAGFFIRKGGVVRDSVARLNTDDGFILTDAVAENCNSTENDADGFALTAAVISHCNAFFNGGDGINDQSGTSLITGNRCRSNVAGIHLQGFSSHVEGNVCMGNDIGIDADAVANTIIRNSCTANTVAQFDIVAGNIDGPIVTGANVGTSSNPHANYTQ